MRNKIFYLIICVLGNKIECMVTLKKFPVPLSRKPPITIRSVHKLPHTSKNNRLQRKYEIIGRYLELDYIKWRKKLDAIKNISPENKHFIRNELNMYQHLPLNSEKSNLHKWLSFIFDLPWDQSSSKKKMPSIAQMRLLANKEYFGLEPVKNKFFEMHAVQKLGGKNVGILCLNGPPGTGKTSIAKACAQWMGKKSYSISLSGARDETYIFGHRSTYVGAMPGQPLRAMQSMQENDGVLILDEIDKCNAQMGGISPVYAALLALLDPKQNHAFKDHYAETSFDFSRCTFIATANTTESIPKPLLNRLEVIEISGYTKDEKHIIGKSYIIPKIAQQSGLNKILTKPFISDNVLKYIIDHYIDEAGNRQLEQLLRRIANNIALHYVEFGQIKLPVIQEIKKILGIPQIKNLHEYIM